MSKTFISTVLLTTMVCVPSVQAQTASSGDARVQTVSVRDLDLNNPRDVALLDHRIRKAVRAVCPEYDQRSEVSMTTARNCWNQVYAGIKPARDTAIAAARGNRDILLASNQAR